MTNLNTSDKYDPHALKVLEFTRLIEIVSSFAESEEGRSVLVSTEPSMDIDGVRETLVIAGEFLEAVKFDDPLPGTGVNPVSELLPMLRVEGAILGTSEIAAVADNLYSAQEIRDYFQKREERYPRAWKIVSGLSIYREIVEEVRRVILPDLSISDNASPELRSIRRRLEHARSSLREIIEKSLAGLSDDIVAERIFTIRNGRYVIPVRESMKNKVPGAVHDRSQTGRTLFIEPIPAIEGNNIIWELEAAEKAEISRILAALTQKLASAVDEIAANQDILVSVDVAKAKAKFGKALDCVIPEINHRTFISLHGARHPLLEWKLRNQPQGNRVVPLDFEAGDDVLTIIVTGPNAGGKTVAIKTVGLITMMALAGIPVPAAHGSSVYVPRGIFADIGDEQSIEDDLSTFSSHMKNIVKVIREATEGSLVLLDELGGGTNPADGEAIALAVLEKLTGVRALTVATTHHGGLKVYAQETPGVMNASMEFDTENLRPTFRFRRGVPGSSYAFEIAGRMGMPEEVIREAEAITGGERKTLEGLISEMEEHTRKAAVELEKARTERLRSENMKNEYERKLEEITKKRGELMRDALTESRKIISDANSLIETAIREIREKGAAREVIKDVHERVEKAVEKIEEASKHLPEEEKPELEKPAVLKEGDTVWVDTLGAEGVIEQVMDKGSRAKVRIGRGRASIVVPSANIFASKTKKRKEMPRSGGVSVKTETAPSMETDVRGMTFDEAKEQIDTFLQSARFSGFETVRIIHGKGTGALRRKIDVYLRGNPSVESHRLGGWDEGSYGVTVVTLRK